MKLSHMIIIAVLLTIPCSAFAEYTIGSPYAPVSTVNDAGDLEENWGHVRIELVNPENARVASHERLLDPGPKVVTAIVAGDIYMTKTTYRAPIWGAASDVLDVEIENDSDQAQVARLRLTPSENVSLGTRAGTAGLRPVFSIPVGLEPIELQMNDWGCVGGVVSMPGWARPSEECDDAFKNIRAGMGGVPIVYQFAVPPAGRKTIVLGLCESCHSSPTQRPLVLSVEGDADAYVNPVSAWGQHVPGCVVFDARDLDGDGMITIVSKATEDAPDQNPILNAIWIFPEDTPLDLPKTKSGRMNDQAEYYVDCGGKRDQSLYKPGDVEYEVSLGPNETKSLTFFYAATGSVTNPDSPFWSEKTLEKAARDVWLGWFGDEEPTAALLPEGLR